MRLKNVKGAKAKIEASRYIVNDPLSLKGQYHQLFKNNNPIHIEIGMGKGQFIIENALRYPMINFIGIEKFDSVMVRAIAKAEELELSNLHLMRFDALDLNQVFDHEIALIYLNFSDPWPKKRHAHRRLTSPIFLSKYELIAEDKPHLIIKTDNRDLFEYTITSLSETNYQINNISLNLYEEDLKDNIQTEYETRFVDRGKVIYRLETMKK